MAITSVAALDLNVIPGSQVPSGITNPTVATLTSPIISKSRTMTIAASSFEHASVATTGIEAGIAAVKTEFDTNVDTAIFGLDATQTITLNILIENIERTNTRSAEYISGTENMTVTYRVEWEI